MLELHGFHIDLSNTHERKQKGLSKHIKMLTRLLTCLAKHLRVSSIEKRDKNTIAADFQRALDMYNEAPYMAPNMNTTYFSS